MRISKVFRLGELFCGPGGIALGAMEASISDQDYKIVHQWDETFRILLAWREECLSELQF